MQLTKKTQSIHNAIPIVAAGYSEKYGINISVGGTTAFTDGVTINIPLIDLSELAPSLGVEFGKKTYFGFTAHECAHCRYTDFGVKLTRDPEGQLTNIIEDVRIEILFEKDFPGSREDLESVMGYALFQGYFNITQNMHPMAIALSYLLHMLNARFLDRDACKQVLAAHMEAAVKALPKGWFARVDGLLDKHWPLVSTLEASLLAKAFLSALKDAEEEQKQQSDNQQADQPDNGDESKGESQTGADNQNHDANQSQGGSKNGDERNQDARVGQDGENQENASEQSNAQSYGDNETSGNGASQITRSAFEPVDMAELPKTAHEILQQGIEACAQEANKLHQVVKGDPKYILNDFEDNFLNLAMQQSAGLRNKLLSLVQSRYKARKVSSDTGVRFRQTSISKVASGDNKIYQSKRKKTMPSSAIHLLVDNSGSMKHGCQEVANQMSASLAMAFNAIQGCSIAVTAYPGSRGGNVAELIKRSVNIRHQLKQCNITSRGGTPLAEAMLFAYSELAQAKEVRKVLICITDGDVANPEMVAYLNSHSDVLSLGFVIGSKNHFEDLFDYSVLIRDPKTLQQKTFELVSQVI